MVKFVADIENYMNAVERVLEYTQLEAEEDLKRYPQVQYSTVQYSTVQYSKVQYSTVQYSTVQYSTVSAYHREIETLAVLALESD